MRYCEQIRIFIHKNIRQQSAELRSLPLFYCGKMFIPEFEFDFDCMSLSSEYEFEFEFEAKRTSRNGVFPGGHPSKYQPCPTGLIFGGRVKMNKYVPNISFTCLLPVGVHVCMALGSVLLLF